MADILVIEFPAYTGGCHLANLLSLGENVHPPRSFWPDNDYKKFLVSMYNNHIHHNVHFGAAGIKRFFPESYNLNQPFPKVYEDKFNILNCHAVTEKSMQFYNLHKSQKISLLSSLHWVGVRTQANGIVNIRANPSPSTDNVYNIYNIEISKWCSIDGIDELKSLNDKLNLGLDLDLCNELHLLWYKKIWAADHGNITR
jgi:hypothetical protein